jgi:hydrogenase maturation protease
MLYQQLQNDPSYQGEVDLEVASLAGWRLIDLLAGYKAAVLIDCVKGGPGQPGDCYRVAPESAWSENLRASHGIGLIEAIELAQIGGLSMPQRLDVYAIEVQNPDVFGEGISEVVETKLSDAVALIKGDLGVQQRRDEA